MSYGKDNKKETQKDLDRFRSEKKKDDETIRRTKTEGVLKKQDPNFKPGGDYTGQAGRINENTDYASANKSADLFMQKRESNNLGIFAELSKKFGRTPTLDEMTEARRKNDAALYSGMTMRGETPSIDFGAVTVRGSDSRVEAPDQKIQQFFESIDRLNQDDREIRDEVRGPRNKK